MNPTTPKPKPLRTDLPHSPDFQQSPTLQKILGFEKQYQDELVKKDPLLSTLADLINESLTPEERERTKSATPKSWQQVSAENPHLASTGLRQLAEAEASALERNTQRKKSKQ